MSYKNSFLIFLCITFLNTNCKKDNCDKSYTTENIYDGDKSYYFPNKQNDTLRFIYNGIDTIVFVASDLISQYDQQTFSPQYDGCPSYFNTQNITQYLKSSNMGTIKLNSLVTQEEMSIMGCSPCEWDLQVTFGQDHFGNPGWGLAHIGKWGDTITFNNTKYRYVQYMTGNNSQATNYKDTLYLTGSGIIRIVTSVGIYDRL